MGWAAAPAAASGGGFESSSGGAGGPLVFLVFFEPDGLRLLVCAVGVSLALAFFFDEVVAEGEVGSGSAFEGSLRTG